MAESTAHGTAAHDASHDAHGAAGSTDSDAAQGALQSVGVDLQAPPAGRHAADAHLADIHGETHAGEHAAHGHVEGPYLGRHVQHPPEPPHLTYIWYKKEQKALIKEYVKKHPNEPEPAAVENWLTPGPGHDEWVVKEGEAPTMAQVLHMGTLTKPLPLINYAPWENHVYLSLAALLTGIIFVGGAAGYRAANRRSVLRKPGRGQMVVEMIVGGFDDFCKGILGEDQGRRYMPFIATLFWLILIANLMGLVPLFKPATSSVLITFSLALCTFIVVQSTAWVKLGPGSYIYHLLGQPKDPFGWFLGVVLFLPLEIISDFIAKPLSLALRLFGNMLGKDILLGSFMGMGIGLVAVISHTAGDYVGLPLTLPFLILGLLLSTIQALVFSLLSCIYISMVLPHDHEHGEEHGEHGHGHDLAHGHGHGAAHGKTVHEAIPS